ncbi:hypothetical protein BD626DRAFT_514090 [Schizophyllum amplum]|uniref:Uncharacterized protein n=1 Tax=Schizophyllum amplum TaxID=97359 RepID=A0A550BYK0_9AGAR|nr:hypothetical protein BD626DRAFT_514090 [Auriculariopsis ampla]
MCNCGQSIAACRRVQFMATCCGSRSASPTQCCIGSIVACHCGASPGRHLWR